MALFCWKGGRWEGGGGTGLLATLRSSVRALLGPAGFVVVSGGGCGDVGDHDSKLTLCALAIASKKQRAAGNEIA